MESVTVAGCASTNGSVLQISTKLEHHCIELTDIDKRINDVKSELEHVKKSLDDRTTEVCELAKEVSSLKEKSKIDSGKKERRNKEKQIKSSEKQIKSSEKQIKSSEKQKEKLEKQKEKLEEQKESIKKDGLTLVGGTVIRLIKGKTSGVTGGAVVEIEKDGKKKQYMLKNIFDTEKTYKNVFRQEKRRSGKHYYNPNCKSETRSFLTRHTLKEVNTSVIQEFIALRLANVVSPGIAPGVILGEIEDTVNGEKVKRYCLLTEMAVQDGEMAVQEKSKTFDTLNLLQVGSKNDKPFNVEKKYWQFFYAIGVALLNDNDVNKKDNIGVVKQGETSKLLLFDLGNASPDKFKLDPKTLLPKSKSRLADFVLWLINLFVPANSIPGTFYFDKDIQGILTIDERKKAIQDLLSCEGDIMDELKKIEEDIPGNDKKIVEDMKRRIEARFGQLRDVLEAHSKINATKTRKNENNVSHSSKQEEVGEVAESRQALKQELGGLMEKSQSQSSSQNVEGKTTDVNQAFVQELKERQKEMGSQSSEQNGGGEAADVDITIEEIPD